MSNSTATINFKLQIAPGAVEIFSVGSGSVDELEKKLDEFGLTLDNVYAKNPKGSLVPLRRRLDRIGAGDQVKLFAIVSDSDESGESSDSGEDQEEEVVIIETPRQFGRRERSRSRGRRDRSRSRSHSRGKKFLKHLSKRVEHLERSFVGGVHHHHHGKHGFGEFEKHGGFGGIRRCGKPGGFRGPVRSERCGTPGRHGSPFQGFGGPGRQCGSKGIRGPERSKRCGTPGRHDDPFGIFKGPGKSGRHHGGFGGPGGSWSPFEGFGGPRWFGELGKLNGSRREGYKSS